MAKKEEQRTRKLADFPPQLVFAIDRLAKAEAELEQAKYKVHGNQQLILDRYGLTVPDLEELRSQLADKREFNNLPWPERASFTGEITWE